MDINRIGEIRIGEIEKIGFIKPRPKEVKEEGDSVSISSIGRYTQEIDHMKTLAFNVISNLSEIRDDKVEIAINRIKEDYYSKHIKEIVNSLINPPI